MRYRDLMTALLATSLAAAPASAQSKVTANPAAKLSIADSGKVRASSIRGKPRATGQYLTPYIVGGVLLVGGVVAIALSMDGDNSDSN